MDTIGGGAIALGVIQLAGLIFSALLFNRVARRQRNDESLLNETWRLTRNKIQYGYQNYQYA
jgi:hypothetical protein